MTNNVERLIEELVINCDDKKITKSLIIDEIMELPRNEYNEVLYKGKYTMIQIIFDGDGDDIKWVEWFTIPETNILDPDDFGEEFEYVCGDCDETWTTNGDRPKCPKCRSERWDYVN